MSKKGRKPILTEDEAKKVINSYVIKHGATKEIKYVDIHNYCVDLSRNKEILKIPSESFWRKKDRIGRKLIDEVNISLFHKLKRNENEYDLQNLLKLIEDKVADKKTKETIFNELKSKSNKIKQLEKEINIKENNILVLKKTYEDSMTLNKQQQDLISQVFHYFLNHSTNENLEFFDSAFKNTFSNPIDYLSILKQEKKQAKYNVSDFFKNRLEK